MRRELVGRNLITSPQKGSHVLWDGIHAKFVPQGMALCNIINTVKSPPFFL